MYLTKCHDGLNTGNRQPEQARHGIFLLDGGQNIKRDMSKYICTRYIE